MITLLRPSAERGRTKIDWLDSYHTFSFGDYQDAKHMNFGHLRVINEDWVKPGEGFGMHGHRDMEIITYVLEGKLEHRDSLGTGSVIQAGDVQAMSAGTGVRHSEFNASKSDPVHLLQIWIIPDEQGLAPRYEQKSIVDPNKKNQWQLLASRDGKDGSITVFQDLTLSQAFIEKDQQISYQLSPTRQAWLQVVCGKVELDGNILSDGDGAGILGKAEQETVTFKAQEASEILLFDLFKTDETIAFEGD